MSALSQRFSAVGSQRPRKDDQISLKDELQSTFDENGNPIQEGVVEDEQSGDEKAELYDEINSLYNLENPKGDTIDEDDKRSQYTS